MGLRNPIKPKHKRPRIVRYADLVPCFDAFIDTRSPGSDKKENFTIIGPGVSENPNQHVHIAEPHGFNIGGARQPPGCVNSQHSHDTAEVFFVHSGTWSFNMGEHGNDAKITLRPGDLISIPTQAFRGFTNIGEDIGFLWAVLGKDNPGRVLWAPDVFDMAKDYGLVLLESGMLIDTAKGEKVPDHAKVMPVTSREQIAKLKAFSDEDLRTCCVLAKDDTQTVSSGDVTLRKLIGGDTPLDWPHGFSISQLTLKSEGQTELQTHDVPEVIFVHSGELKVITGEDVSHLGPGDTATLPIGVARRFQNVQAKPAEIIQVLGEA